MTKYQKKDAAKGKVGLFWLSVGKKIAHHRREGVAESTVMEACGGDSSHIGRPGSRVLQPSSAPIHKAHLPSKPTPPLRPQLLQVPEPPRTVPPAEDPSVQ